MANKELGEKLKELRIREGLTQKDVYEQLGISQSTFSSWEIGKSEPDAITFLTLCRMYNIEDIIYEFTGKALNVNKTELTLTTHERQLVKDYRSLSSQGKEYIRQTMYMAKNIYQEEAGISNMESIKGA